MAFIRTFILAFLSMVNATVPAMINGWRPKIIDKWLHVTQDGYAGVTRYHSRRGIGPKIIVIHVQEGNNWGSWQHFHSVLASSTVLISKLGDIWNLVHKTLAPWTNGDVQQPSYFMQTIMNRWGWDPNTFTLSVEREGYSRERTDAQDKSIVWQVWQWMQEFDIEAIYIVGHYEVNSVTRPNCPDPAPHNLIKMIRAAVSGAGVPVIEDPDIDTQLPGHDLIRDPWKVVDANGRAWDGKSDITVNGIKFYGQLTTVRVGGAGVNQRQWASDTSNLVGSVLQPGTGFQALGWVEGAEVSGERRWWVKENGARIWAGATMDKPKAPAPIPTTPDDGVSKPDTGNDREAIPVVLNGNTYLPVWQRDETGKLRMKIRAKEAANVRLWAGTHVGSRIVDTMQAGETAYVTHYVKGEPVDIAGLTNDGNRNIWYVLEHPSGDGIRKGGRIWSGLIELI